MNDKTRGKIEQAKGKVKEEVGKLGGDRSTEWGGKLEQAKGKVREGLADLRRDDDEVRREDVPERPREDLPR